MELASQEEAGARAFAGLYGRRDAPILSILITTSVMTLASCVRGLVGGHKCSDCRRVLVLLWAALLRPVARGPRWPRSRRR